jgi:hypothetical protein
VIFILGYSCFHSTDIHNNNLWTSVQLTAFFFFAVYCQQHTFTALLRHCFWFQVCKVVYNRIMSTRVSVKANAYASIYNYKCYSSYLHEQAYSKCTFHENCKKRCGGASHWHTKIAEKSSYIIINHNHFAAPVEN